MSLKSAIRISALSSVVVIANLTSRAAGKEETGSYVRPVQSAWTVGIGSSHLCDTYLSPLKYQGWTTSLGFERIQASWWSPMSWSNQLKINVDIERALNPARNAAMWAAQFHLSWGVIRRWTLPYNLKAGIGPVLNLDAGCLYNNRNSNNPASAKGALTIDATGYIAKEIKLLKLPVTLRWQPTTAVIGAFFSPKYDELYYEIYLGNRSGLVHSAWWGNRFRLDNLISADLHFGSTALRLGYECDWMSSKISNITTRIITHRFIIGVTTEWLGLNTAHKLNLKRAKVISAL